MDTDYLPHFEEAAGIITSILQTKKSRLFINSLADTELLRSRADIPNSDLFV